MTRVQVSMPDGRTAGAAHGAGGAGGESRIRGRRPPHGEPVLSRAFRILAAFGPDDRSLSLTSLSARAGLPAPSALRIARQLVDLGALERDEEGRYMVGLRLLEIASLAPRGHGLRGTALPYMEDLHHATGQHVLLAVRDGHEAILVERLSARRAGRVLYRIGGRMPMHATGVGLVLLAHAPVQIQQEVLAGDLTVEPGHALASERELRVLLAAIRRDGVATASRQRPEPMTSVAAPVLNNRRVVGALSVVAQSGNLQPAALTPAVVAVARAISRAVSAVSAALPRRNGNMPKQPEATNVTEETANDASRSGPCQQAVGRPAGDGPGRRSHAADRGRGGRRRRRRRLPGGAGDASDGRHAQGI
jgi:DNA-binding IclR family transcriptional regulator